MVTTNSITNKRRTIGNFLLRLNTFAYFFSIAFAALGLTWTVVEFLSFLEVDFSYLKENKTTAIYLWIVHSILVGFIALYVREAIRNAQKVSFHPNSDKQDSILASDLIKSLKTALKNKNYLEVIRLGAVLSRPLFISGYYSTRAEIGSLVEEAAATINNKEQQMIALIDSVGWSNIELGNLDKAEKAIEHGQNIAKELNNVFYISKSYRHLGVIQRRKKQFKIAEIKYKEAMKFAEQLDDKTDKNESLGGINYALSNLYYLKKDYVRATDYIDESIKYFSLNKDEIRNNLSIIKKADIYFDEAKISESKDLYRQALNTAERISHRLHMMRSYLGLSKIYISESNWESAVEYLIKAKEIDVELNSVNEAQQISELVQKLPEEQKTLYNNVYKQ